MQSIKNHMRNRQSSISMSGKLPSAINIINGDKLRPNNPSISPTNLSEKYFPRNVIHVNTMKLENIPLSSRTISNSEYKGNFHINNLNTEIEDLTRSISPPPIFPIHSSKAKKFEYKIQKKESTKTRLWTKLHMVTAENMELKKQCKEMREQKMQNEYMVNLLTKENKELIAKIKDKSFINTEEQSKQLINLIIEAKDSLAIYKVQLERVSIIFKELTEYMSNIMETKDRNYNRIIKMIYEKLHLNKIESSKIKKTEENIENIINEYSNQYKFPKSDIVKLKVTEYLTMKIKIEELKDEVKLSYKWKNLCMNLLSLANMDKSQIDENGKNLAKNFKAIRLLKYDAEELQEELICKELLNIDLNEKILENKLLKSKLKESAQHKDLDDVIYKMSLIILSKYNENDLTDKNRAVIQRIFGAKTIKEFQRHKIEVKNLKANYKILMHDMLQTVF